MPRYFQVSESDPVLNNILTTTAIMLFLLLTSAASAVEIIFQDTLSFETSATGPGEEVFMPDPRKASLYSAVLPGMGQIYNRRYWKVPLVYGGFAGLGWYFMFSNEQFVRYRNALNFRIDGNPETIDEFINDPRYTEDILTRFKDYYRRQRDRTVIWSVLFYAVTIIDATVDAHFYNFDVGEELGIRLGPSLEGPDYPVIGRPGPQMGLGLKFSINF